MIIISRAYLGLLALQLICWSIFQFFLSLFLPVICPLLLNGMHLWNNAEIMLCFAIEYTFLIVLIELRESLIQKAHCWILKIPRRFVRRILFILHAICYGSFLLTLYNYFGIPFHISFMSCLQELTLTMLIGSIYGITMPMSAKRFWSCFKKPLQAGNVQRS